MILTKVAVPLDKNPKTTGGKVVVEELDQIVGNAEDDIGDHILAVREEEMLFGDNSLLAVFGPMIVHICGTPKKFKVQSRPQAMATAL